MFFLKEINMKIKLTIAAIGFTVISALFLNGCQTTKGFGQDLEKGGQAIQKAATQETDTTKK